MGISFCAGKPCRVMLVEDDRRLRASFARALGRHEDIAVVAETDSASEARKLLVAGLWIDVAFVDLRLGATSGIDVIRAVCELQPEAAAIALTIFDDSDTVRAAILAGARGYILKDVDPDALSSAAREAGSGGAPMTPVVARWTLDALREASSSGSSSERNERLSLTARQEEIVALLCEGHTYAEVSDALGIGIGTVQTHVKAVYAKLGVGSKAELAAIAFRRGLVR